ncbi:MAG: SdiA-regulated domain-containing protein [Ignavibacteria bacterium]|nr:SdiA-regulated domain-containing protein [Ignavibacteria bacterium]MBT8383418.1 SdiA-regulated domain-containing protein [Ignavibacteria bacterium]MBT8390250.1 SdiA-regulated domain-containing protein [Ignavibacteria bacterium]NNJ52865.1 hypothetical protein [Ignavibacteriaceae bacterium]NNL20553.1 hypothetical protein [Ignavibacteriaceae bacterium]
MIHNSHLSLFLILLIITALGCVKKEEEQTKTQINYLKAYDIPVSEPSALDLTFREKGFWTVSDNNNTVYKLDNWGKIVKSFEVEGTDLEGISILDENKLAVVFEREREIVIVDTSGVELKRIKVDLAGELNHGLEGITYDTESKRFFVLNEKIPCLLFSFDENLNELSRDTLNYIKDASGIHFDARDKSLWILSDESQCITKCDLRGNPIQTYYITVNQPEGLTIDSEGNKMYVVSDINDALYVFSLE